MARLIILTAIIFLTFSQLPKADERRFVQTECGKPYPLRTEFFVIKLKAADGISKRLTFNNKAGDGLLVFKSTSLKYLKWAIDFTRFEYFSYREIEQRVGMLSTKFMDDQLPMDFGTISEGCWDGLRNHISGLVQAIESARE